VHEARSYQVFVANRNFSRDGPAALAVERGEEKPDACCGFGIMRCWAIWTAS
jgi:hypothetical protein